MHSRKLIFVVGGIIFFNGVVFFCGVIFFGGVICCGFILFSIGSVFNRGGAFNVLEEVVISSSGSKNEDAAVLSIIINTDSRVP